MALKPCADCGREVSTKAAACPGCGCPVPKDEPSVAPENSEPHSAPDGLKGAESPPRLPKGELRKWPVTPRTAVGVLLGLVWIVVAVRCATSEARHCSESTKYVADSIERGAWRAAENALPQARQACAGRPQDEIIALTKKIQDHAQQERAQMQPNIAPAEDSYRAIAHEKITAAAKVWRAYADLPLNQQTKAAWAAAIAESTRHGEGLPPPHDTDFTNANMGMARDRGARFINEEAYTSGDFSTVLVPSRDRAKCIIWASQWIQEADGLRQLGFLKLRCEGTRYRNKMTGEFVEEPARDWIVP